MSQEFGGSKISLVKQKGFYTYEYMSYIGKFKQKWPRKKSFIVCEQLKKISEKEQDHIHDIWNKLKRKQWLSRHVLKVWRFVISWCI